jgi:hypothetical protein
MPLAGFLDSPSTPWLTIPMADEGVRVSVEPEHTLSLVKVSLRSRRGCSPPDDDQ